MLELTTESAIVKSASDVTTFESLSLNPAILRAIQEAGYTEATPIQSKAIPEVMAGHDVMASAQTGTGKTAAFTLPALNLLATPHEVKSRGPRILVLVPTRELAVQVNDAMRKYGKYMRARTVSIVGGMPYPLQNKLLSQPLDMLVATPGRFIDHLERGRIDLSRLQMLVLDEADRMLDMGFMPDIKRICEALPEARQTLMFSATFEGEIAVIAKTLLKQPKTIQIASQHEKHKNIEQKLLYVDDMTHKNKLLEHLLIDPEVNQAIIFTSTKRHADVLAEDLYAAGHRTAALHGDMTQHARNRTLTKLRHGDVKVLVATDVAARGIDIHGITHVINYDLPKFAEDYVHRIGRTGRAGNSGIAISFAAHNDRFQVRKIEQFTGQRIELSVIPGLEPRRPAPKNDDRKPRSNSRHGRNSSEVSRKSARPSQNQEHRQASKPWNERTPKPAFQGDRPTTHASDKRPVQQGRDDNFGNRVDYAQPKRDDSRKPRVAHEHSDKFGKPFKTDNGMRKSNDRGARRPRNFV